MTEVRIKFTADRDAFTESVDQAGEDTEVINEQINEALDNQEMDLENIQQQSESTATEIELRNRSQEQEIIEKKAEIDQLDQELKQVQTKVDEAKLNISGVLAAANAALGFISLGTALAGEQLDAQFSAVIGLALLSLQQIVQLQAIGAVSGNLALFVAAGALASSAAGAINQLRGFQIRSNAALAKQRRRTILSQEDN